MKNKTVIHLISGFLGVGKTTLLKSLIKQKPANEKWALIVNEFGDIGIDGAALTNNNLPLIEISGGCLCCLAGPQMVVSIVNLLHREKPDRLLIEASGLANIVGVIDELNKPPLKNSLQIGTTLTVIDVRQFIDNNYFRNPLYRDQINIADVLIASKIDLVDVEMLDCFYDKAKQLFPPKEVIVKLIDEEIPLACLKVPCFSKYRYKPNIKKHEIKNFFSFGFLLESNNQFDAEKISLFFNKLPEIISGLLRAKGIFCIENSWILFNWVDGVWGVNEVAWRRDNRFELIAKQNINQKLIEVELNNCLSGVGFEKN